MSRLSGSMLAVVAVIHLLPVAGVLGAARLESLYGVTLGDPNLELLLRHRAVLFGLLGAFLLGAVFRPALRPLAYMAGFVSVLGFLLLAPAGTNPAIDRVVWADWAALACLVVGSVAEGLGRRRDLRP